MKKLKHKVVEKAKINYIFALMMHNVSAQDHALIYEACSIMQWLYRNVNMVRCGLKCHIRDPWSRLRTLTI